MVSEWALAETATADLGDERLDTRMALVLSALGDRPNASIPAACRGHAEIQAAYRFFDNTKVGFANVLAPHCIQTRQRIAAQDVALLVQDTTEIELIRPTQEVQGAGTLDGVRQGMLLHALHGFTPDGTPLGTLWAEAWNRPQVLSEPQRRARPQTPIEEKESLRWLTGLREARKLAAELPHVQCICVADSEADFYELLAEPRGSVEWLVRVCHDDRILQTAAPDAPRLLHQAVQATPVRYRMELLIRERQARSDKETRVRRQTRQRRQAQVEVRATTVTLRPPRHIPRPLPPVTVQVVLVREPHPPAGEPPVEWLLVTSLPVATAEQVRQVIAYYCVRWNIEIFFRTLKSGCRIEYRRFEHIERLLPCLALYLIVAWRTLFVCRMGRGCPDADCEVVLAPAEWKAVWVAVHHRKLPKKRPRLGEMVRLVAQLGGYIPRPHSEPGPQTIWIGLQRMYDLAWAWESFGPGGRIRDA